MKTVIIYHEAVSKLIFMRISFIVKIIVHRQTFRYLLFLSFIVKIIVYLRNNRRCQNIIMYRQSSFIMETIVTSGSTWIVETISRVWEATKIKVKTVANSLKWERLGNNDGVSFNFTIKLYTEY